MVSIQSLGCKTVIKQRYFDLERSLMDCCKQDFKEHNQVSKVQQHCQLDRSVTNYIQHLIELRNLETTLS